MNICASVHLQEMFQNQSCTELRATLNVLHKYYGQILKYLGSYQQLIIQKLENQ